MAEWMVRDLSIKEALQAEITATLSHKINNMCNGVIF